MSAGITRVHGTAYPGSLYGYQTRFFTVAGSGFQTSYGTVGCNFEGALRAIESVASITMVGTPTSAGFVVGIDGDTFYGRDDHTGYAADNSTQTLTTLINAYVSIYPQVAEVVLSGVSLAAGTVADWDNIV